jgi:hypothetical protein
MKTFLLLCGAATLAVAPAALADSKSVAAAFAAATPTRYEGVANFIAANGSATAHYRYVFTMDRDFRVTALAVNGVAVSGVSADSPLASLPYPVVGRVESFELTLQAWDDTSAPLPALAPSPGSSSFGLVSHGDQVAVSEVVVARPSTGAYAMPTNQTVTFDVNAGAPPPIDEVGEGAAPGDSAAPRASASSAARSAGTGYAWHDELRRGDTVQVSLSPADLVRFMPVPEIFGTRPGDWSLDVSGGSASGPVLVNGQWGFWVFLNPSTFWGYDYWLRGPAGYSEWGPIDPDEPNPGDPGLKASVAREGGVELIDLRGRWPMWARVSGTIDGNFSAGQGWDRQLSHIGEAVAVRLDSQVSGVNVHYAGDGAYVIVRELDETGAQTYNGDGTAREWLVSSATPRYGTYQTAVSGYVPVSTGRASIEIVPLSDQAQFGAYDLLVEVAAYGGKG